MEKQRRLSDGERSARLGSPEPALSNRGFGGTSCSSTMCSVVTFPRQIWHEIGKVRQRVDVWKLRAMAAGEEQHGGHKQCTTSAGGGTNFPPVCLASARFRPQTTGSEMGQSTCDFSNKPSNR